MRPLDLSNELARMGVRNVARNRRRSLLTGAMVLFAVATVVFFKGYTLGIRRMMVSGVVESMLGALQIQREGYAEAQDLAPLELDLPATADGPALAAAGVKATAPRLRFTGLLAGPEGTATFMGIGMDPVRERKVCPLGMGARASTAGSFNALVSGEGLAGDDDGIVLASELAQGLGLKVGDPITLQVRTRHGSMDTADAVVRGIFRFDDPQGNRMLALVPLRLAQRVLHMEGRVTAFAVALHDAEALDPAVAAVQAALAQRQAVPATVHRWTELAPYLRDVIELQDDVFGVVLVVVVLLVVAGVANTMMMSVQERRREIGTLMSLGFRRWAIVALFLFEAGWLGLLSAALGAIAGSVVVLATGAAGIGFAIPSGSTILVFPELHAAHVALAVGVSLLGALFAAALPAYRACRLQPVEALRSL